MPFAAPARFGVGVLSERGRVRDLSPSGMFIETDAEIRAGTEIDFLLECGDRPVRGRARVAHCLSAAERLPSGLGLSFEGLPPSTVAAIERLALGNRRAPLASAKAVEPPEAPEPPVSAVTVIAPAEELFVPLGPRVEETGTSFLAQYGRGLALGAMVLAALAGFFATGVLTSPNDVPPAGTGAAEPPELSGNLLAQAEREVEARARRWFDARVERDFVSYVESFVDEYSPFAATTHRRWLRATEITFSQPAGPLELVRLEVVVENAVTARTALYVLDQRLDELVRQTATWTREEDEWRIDGVQEIPVPLFQLEALDSHRNDARGLLAAADKGEAP